ncbi:MAG: hypothetical protein M1830_006032, partial [Pleopsidium flavum]
LSMDGEVSTEEWITDPNRSMIPDDDGSESQPKPAANYGLRAVITHYGRHENGHYICYRKHPYRAAIDALADEKASSGKAGLATERWWRLSDDEVTMVSEQNVLDQGDVFMLFYERLDDPKVPEPALPPSHPREPAVDVLGEATQRLREEPALVVDGEKPAPSFHELPTLEERTAPADTQSPKPSQAPPPLPLKLTESPPLQNLPDRPLDTISHHAPAPSPPAAATTTSKDSEPEEQPPPPITPEKSSPQKENSRITPPMRTAGPHRKGGPRRRAGNAMSSTSSMISAN